VGRRREAGFTLFEVAVALALLAVGVLAICTSILATVNLYGTAKEREVAAAAALSKADELWRAPFGDLYRDYSAASPGEYFDVPDLEVPAGRPAVGRVVFLRESQIGGAGVAGRGADSYFGQTIDLNGDGDTGDGPFAGAPIHPIAIEVQYRSRYGTKDVASLVVPVIVGPKQQDEEALP